MHWEKLGKIFDPREHKTLIGHYEFAQSPQVLLFEGFVRVYFSTRERDKSGKYLSQIFYVDFDKAFNVIRTSEKPVIELGKLGCYDEHGIFPLNVLRMDGRVFGFIGGWNRKVSVSVDGAIGVAISTDEGETFQRVGDGPALAAALNEPFLVGDPFVKQVNDTFHMWYIFGKTWKRFDSDSSPDRIYKIAHATSTDGLNWEREGRPIISDKLNSEESQALPTVIKVDELYHMLFCYRQSSDFRKNRDRGYRIGHAHSVDLSGWHRDDDELALDVTEGSWDSDMLCYPHLFEMDGNIYLMYNGNEFGKYGFGLAVLKK